MSATTILFTNSLGITEISLGRGPRGARGYGFAAGGTTGQVTRKASNTDYDFEYHTPVKADVGLGNVDNTSDANKPISSATQTALDLKASITYVDGLIAANDAMVFKGAQDCSANPNYPAGNRGDTYRVSVAGKIGGASGVVVEAGDLFICNTDSTASGNQATVGTSWNVIQTNIDGAVVGPASATDGVPVLFNGTTGKLIKAGTFSAFKTSLALAKGDVALGNVDNTSDATKNSATATLAGKTIDGGSNTLTNVPAGNLAGTVSVSRFNSGTGASSSTFLRGDGTWATPAGAGDVVGPSSAVDGNITLFDGTTGKLLKDGGFKIAEGSWTPTVVDSAGNAATYSARVGSYERVGRKITARFYISLATAGTLSSGQQLRIGGLPFTSANVANEYGTCVFSSLYNVTFPASTTMVGGFVPPNAGYVTLVGSGSGANTIMNGGQAGATAEFIGVIEYRV